MSGVVYVIGIGAIDRESEARCALAALSPGMVVCDPELEVLAAEAAPDVSRRVLAADATPAEAAALLTRWAGEHDKVARLLAGDPLSTDRGIREVEALADAGTSFQLRSAPTRIGLALTAAGIAVPPGSALTLGPIGPDAQSGPARVPAVPPAGEPVNLALELAGASAEEPAGRLLEAGWPGATPVALLSRPATSRQQVVVGTLTDPPRLGAPDDGGYAVLAVGEFVRSRERLQWLERRPLHGVRVVVTRPREQAIELAADLRALGAETVLFPTIRIVPPSDPEPLRAAVRSLETYAWLIFTSANGVRWFWDALLDAGLDARALAGLEIACIGPATAETLAERGVSADLVPDRFVAESVLEALTAREIGGRRVLLPRAARARAVLPEGLEAAGARVDVVEAYRSLPATEGVAMLRARLGEPGTNVLTFTSSSTVHNFVEAVGTDVDGRVAAIGPITAGTARELGLEVDIEAQEYTVPGLIRALVSHFGSTHEPEALRGAT